MSQIRIDQNECIGCGTCVAICNQVFALGDNGKAKVINQSDVTNNPEVKEAMSACPNQAISRTD